MAAACGAQYGIAGPAGPKRELELVVGALPVADCEEDGAMVGSTGCVEMGGAESTLEVVGGSDPLHRPLDVSAATARSDRAAADEYDGVEVAPLASEGGGHRLVEQCSTVGDVT